METVREVREDPPEELAESNWSAKGGYGWVAADVHNQSSLFRLSRLLNSWLNCTPVIAKGVSGGIVSLERVSAIDRVSHGQDRVTEKFFYMYMCHFSQLHVRLPLDDFTMDGSTKFSFSWTGTPSRYKDMGTDELLAGDKEVVETLMKFTDKLPTKGLIRVYNSVHPIIDIEGARARWDQEEGRVAASTRQGEGCEEGPVSGAGSASGVKGPESGLIELPEISVRKDIAINLPDTIINSIDGMEADHIVRTMVEFGSKALILSRHVGSLYRWEVKERVTK
ncbi:hypothetical protein DEO72_LG1g2233 [Vigna unguiculata]|uniref:Uncharacterized protein n=1 Tax=Vigna unguiculata TaxID=3917 RepID=A0A4D6KS85_VIGUN|nr:hypothetical protein DEO72_LG1g2233 [Vigna unguiculata]